MYSFYDHQLLRISFNCYEKYILGYRETIIVVV